MNDIKIKAIRTAVIGLSESDINKLIETAGTDIIYELIDYLTTNGSDIETINAKVRRKFIDYVDKHTTILRPNINLVVIESKRDFLVEDWENIFKTLFPTTPQYDDVVYALETETHSDNTTEFETILYKTWDSVNMSFDGCKLDTNEMMDNISEDWEVEVDGKSQYQVQDNYFETYVDVKITKKVLF